MFVVNKRSLEAYNVYTRELPMDNSCSSDTGVFFAYLPFNVSFILASPEEWVLFINSGFVHKHFQEKRKSWGTVLTIRVW